MNLVKKFFRNCLSIFVIFSLVFQYFFPAIVIAIETDSVSSEDTEIISTEEVVSDTEILLQEGEDTEIVSTEEVVEEVLPTINLEIPEITTIEESETSVP